MHLNAACIQLTSTNDLQANIAQMETWVRRAAKAGAQFVALPENAFFMRAQGESAPHRHTLETHPGVVAARALAQELKCWLLIGSAGIASDDEAQTRRFNRSILIDGEGCIVAYYDKIHLFDVEVGDGQQYQESAHVLPGELAVLADTPWGHIGMTVCYDLRFAALYRALAQAGAAILTVPAAFTRVTGEAHWHALLRARAIETGCFVLAPAQCGTHSGGRQTYGHSLIVNPWGVIIAEAVTDEPQIISARLNLDEVLQARTRIPALKHDRPFRLQSFTASKK